MRKRQGEEFEEYIAYIYQTLLTCSGQNISVKRRAAVEDTRGNTYEIDVFYEFEIAGVKHRVAMECKDKGRRVERNEAIAFYGKIQDMPSTIGVFVSRSGFQVGAAKYLDDHGILRYEGSELPSYASTLAAIVMAGSLPSDKIIGQPFWTIMQSTKGEASGTWMLLPRGTLSSIQSDNVFPLFYSFRHAEIFRERISHVSPEGCVRGLQQTHLRFITNAANQYGNKFVILSLLSANMRDEFIAEQLTPQQIADDYLVGGLKLDRPLR